MSALCNQSLIAPPVGVAVINTTFTLFILLFKTFATALPVEQTAVIRNLTKEQIQIAEAGDKKHIFFSWSGGFRVTTNGSHHSFEEKPHEIVATGSDINGTLNVGDFFPPGYLIGAKHFGNDSLEGIGKDDAIENSSVAPRRRRRDTQEERELREAMRNAKADHDKNEEHEHESEDEFELSPEMKVKIYSAVILCTIFLVVFVMCIWPLFKCCRTCCQVGTAGCLACWDLIHCRDPGYRVMCLAAKQAGLDPPSPEEYDRFMTGQWPLLVD
ncbi:hypothetical protein BV898_01823 [Hypsibius exemplaris]|uniref:Uncharacterized protein n=1 Tax=Hypsibius exemplaris TaxID=2072580 RepID=A0A1W0XAD5_HYPEX|nr:hypothetical protein BV898_01823 [Hypsibius exemplaris]